jgi:hypothetical protein
MVDLNSLYREQKAGVSSPVDLNALYQQQHNGVNLNDLYHGANNGNINLDAIEQIESNGNNSATSSVGAKGLYQFMPDTAAQYSKRLFGKATRDASTLSPEQQNKMASAYFNDLLKEFDGNKDKAIAAYNWGQGNVEKDVKEHGSNWLEYAPEETQKYVNKYHKLSGDGAEHEGYEHQNYAYDENKSHWQNFKDFNHEQAEQMGDLWDGFVAEINKHTGNEYSQDDIDTAKDALGTEQGKALKTSSAVAASVIAPELIPEIAGGAEAGTAIKGLNWLAKGAAGSAAYQGVENGDVSLKQTAEDLATGAALEGGIRAIAKPAAKQVKNMFKSLYLSEVSNPELANATRNYLAFSRVGELAKHLKVLRAENPKALLTDAYKAMAEEVPDVFKGSAGKDMYEITRKMKNNVNAENLADYAKSNASEWLDTAKGLAKTDSDSRKIKTVAEAALANSKGSFRVNTTDIPDEVAADTLLQKLGKTADDWMGFDSKIIKRVFGNSAFKKVEADANAVKEMIGKDNRRINRELKKLNGKTGVSENAKRSALNRQKTLNSKMTQYISDGMTGKRVHIADIQTAVKEVQEGQFNSEATKSVTKSFKELSDRFEAMQVHKLAVDKTLLGMVGKGAIKKAATAGVAAAIGLPAAKVAGALATGATIAGGVARASKVRNLTKAWKLLNEEVASGNITFNQARQIMESGFKNKAKAAGRVGTALREAVNGEDN